LLGERLFRVTARGRGPGTGRARRCPRSGLRGYPAGAGRRGRGLPSEASRRRPPWSAPAAAARTPVRRAACPAVAAVWSRRPAVPVRLILLVPAAHDRAYACAEGRWGRLSSVSWLPLTVSRQCRAV